jgi:hypothetical protein
MTTHSVSTFKSLFFPSSEARKINIKFFFVTFFLFFAVFRLDAVAAPEVEKKEDPLKSALSRIEQTNLPFSTISLNYAVEKSEDSGKTWKLEGKYHLLMDRKSKSIYLREEDVVRKDSSVDYISNGVLTKVHTIEIPALPDPVKAKKIYSVIIQKGNEPFRGHFSTLLNYAKFGPGLSVTQKGLSMFPDIKPSLIQRNGVEVLQFRSVDEPRENFGIYSLIFDVKSGRLLENEVSIYRKAKNGDKLEKEFAKRITVEDYFSSNGYSFPGKLLWKTSGEQMFRFTINKELSKINEPVDMKKFIPLIPPGSRVFDAIKKVNYVTPELGNSGAEAQVAKELDGLFEGENKK